MDMETLKWIQNGTPKGAQKWILKWTLKWTPKGTPKGRPKRSGPKGGSNGRGTYLPIHYIPIHVSKRDFIMQIV